MGFISSFTLIRSVSLVHLTAAYFFLTAPQILADQNIVVIMGESMKIVRIANYWFLLASLTLPQPPSSAFTKPTEVTALLAIVLAVLGLTDLVAASLPERAALQYWQTQLPLRLVGLFSMTGFIYVTRGDGETSAAALRAIKGESSPFDNLKNSFVFTACFMEVCYWFWVFLCMRDDRRDFLIREAEEARRDEEEKKFRMM